MRKLFALTAIFGALVLALSLAFAEQNEGEGVPEGMPEGMPSGPPEEMKVVAELVGTWDAAVEMRMDPTAEFMSVNGVSEYSLLCGGAVLQDKYTSEMDGKPFEGLGHTSYNPGTGEWMDTWVDNMGGHMSVYVGKEQKDGTVVQEGKDYMMGQEWLTRITRWPIKDGKFNWQLEHSTDGGKSWAVYMKMSYTKRS